jgi:hypothetical protein
MPGDPFRTDLVAVDFDSQGEGWVAGNPVGWSGTQNSSGSRAMRTPQPAPLVRVSTAGTALACPGTPPNSFMFSDNTNKAYAYLWKSIAVFPGGEAVAGGQVSVPSAGTSPVNGSGEAVLVEASCDHAPTITRFLAPTAPPVPADPGGFIASVAANASNDAWAADSGSSGVPYLYHLTDTHTPLAPAGDDVEPRPLVFTSDPTVFVLGPPVVVGTTIFSTKTKAKQGKKIYKKVPPAVYAVHVALRSAGNGSFYLYISFKVRARVTIGAQALRGRTVVSSSGLQRFTPGTGQLVLRLDSKHWPTGIKFVQPKPKKA